MDGLDIAYGDPTAYVDVSQSTPAWQADAYGTVSQSPTTVAPAPVSWLGFSQVPQMAKDIAAVASAGFGLSLAKDQLQANRDIAKVGLQTAYWQAQAGTQSARYGAQIAANQAALAAKYPNGVPFGVTRQDQIMILIGVAGLALAYFQLAKK